MRRVYTYIRSQATKMNRNGENKESEMEKNEVQHIQRVTTTVTRITQHNKFGLEKGPEISTE